MVSTFSKKQHGQPLQDGFENVLNNRTLIRYYNELRLWHGYVRFLGLPHLRDTPDVPIRSLYVEPLLSERHIHHDEDPAGWSKTFPLLEMLVKHPQLVLLGDPGSGKSALVNWIIMQFIRPEGKWWLEQMGRLVPIPLILRDLKNLGRDLTWPLLKESFLALPQFKELRDNDVLESVLSRGQAIIMLDGLDEIGDKKRREALRDAFQEGIKLYPDCRWLVTSRIVGYEEVPFEEGTRDRRQASVGSNSENIQKDGVKDLELPREMMNLITKPSPDNVLYLAPFNDTQIERFAMAWYRCHETNTELVAPKALRLFEAIRAKTGTRQLARIPNLLTMMALIHRTRADLPQGRVNLYDDMAEAYLKSIDEYRGITATTHGFGEKCRWLARVGLEMQLQRTGQKKGTEILTTGEKVLGWIADEMSKMISKPEEAEREARDFLEYIKRRSGLLLPRGEDLFAFMHLSFQEYFAARALEDRLTSPHGLPRRSQDGSISLNDLRRFARLPSWRETFVFLFERFAARESWPDHLADLVFGKGFERIFQKNAADHLFRLLADIAVNSYTGLSAAKREAAFISCWRWDVDELNPLVRGGWSEMATAPSLLIAEPYCDLAFETLSKVNASTPIKRMRLAGNKLVEDFFSSGVLRLSS